jgi:hypothetical protein
VACESAADIRAKKADVPGSLRTQAVEHVRRCAEYTASIITKLDETERVLVGEIQQAATQARTATQDGLAGSVSAVDTRLRQDLSAVDALTATARERLDAATDETTRELDTGTAGAVRELDTAAAAVGQGLVHGVEETATVIGEVERPFLPGVREQTAAVRTAMAASVTGASHHLTAAVGNSRGQFASVHGAFERAAHGLVDRAAGQHAATRDEYLTRQLAA